MNIIFDKEKLTAILPVSGINVSSVSYEELKKAGFEEKEELHITIVGHAVGGLLLSHVEKASPDEREKIKSAIEQLLASYEWEYKLRPELFTVAKQYESEKRETCIALIDLPDLASLYEELEKLTGLTFRLPVPHVTLLVRGSKEGIGINSLSDFVAMQPAFINRNEIETTYGYHTIFIPTRPQIDTSIAVYLLKTCGVVAFPGIVNAEVKVVSTMPEGETPESLASKGTLVLDFGGGPFDHHNKEPQTTASALVVKALGVEEDQTLAKLLQFAERDDFYGKGIISEDALDRAFGLPGLLANLNKVHADNPQKVIDTVLPLFDAHVREEVRRVREMPEEVKLKLSEGEAIQFTVKHRGKNTRCIFIASPNPSLPGFLRSVHGGRHDIVLQKLPSGHVNILTRPVKHIDLRSFVAIVRRSELMKRGDDSQNDFATLSRSGKIPQIPEWYYDPATNSLQNGGLHTATVPATKLTREELIKLTEVGISEALWSPAGNKTNK